MIFVVILIDATAYPSSWTFWGGATYSVIFDQIPEITDDRVRLMNLEIGKVREKKLDNQRQIVVTIEIDKQYTEGIRRNGVFIVDKGGLFYETIGDIEAPLLPSESNMQGFATRKEFLWYKTKHAINKGADIIIDGMQKILQ